MGRVTTPLAQSQPIVWTAPASYGSQEISGYESDGHTAAVWVNPVQFQAYKFDFEGWRMRQRQWLLTLQNGAFVAHVG